MKNLWVFTTGFFMLLFFTSGCSNAQELTVATDFVLKDLAGVKYSLSSYKDKQSVLLFFWTTWCPYCLKEMKALNIEYLNLEKKGVALLAINAGEPSEKVSRVVNNYGVFFKVLLDETSAVSEDYRLLGVPTFVLIDKNGKIRFKGNSFPKDHVERLSAEN